MKRLTAANLICTIYCIFSYDCGFNHVSYIWSDVKFNGKVNDICFMWIEASYGPNVLGLCVPLPNGCLLGSFWPYGLVLG